MKSVGRVAAVLVAAALVFTGCENGTVQTAAGSGEEDTVSANIAAVTSAGEAAVGTQESVGNRTPAFAGTDEDAGNETEGISVVSQTFSHREFIDSIAFILPQDWSYDTFETVVAGEDMDAREWGVHVFIEGDQALRFTVCGTNETEEEREGASELFQTGSGLMGKKYVEGAEGEDGLANWEFCLIFEGIEGGGAQYKIYGDLGQEEYEKYSQALDDFAAGVSIAVVARD